MQGAFFCGLVEFDCGGFKKARCLFRVAVLYRSPYLFGRGLDCGLNAFVFEPVYFALFVSFYCRTMVCQFL